MDQLSHPIMPNFVFLSTVRYSQYLPVQQKMKKCHKMRWSKYTGTSIAQIIIWGFYRKVNIFLSGSWLSFGVDFYHHSTPLLLMSSSSFLTKQFDPGFWSMSLLYLVSGEIWQAIQMRRTRHAGHCWRSKNKLIIDVHLWILTYQHTSVNRLAKTYIHQLCVDPVWRLEVLLRRMANT